MKRPLPAEYPARHKKLWLPPEGNEAEDEEMPGAGPAADAAAKAEQEEDDLDRLLNQYEAQAQADISTMQVAQATLPPAGHRGAAARRKAALEQPLPADNKGFRMLAAMGYQAGQGLGQSVEGRVEPIPLDLKQDRLGLGRVSKKAVAREAQRRREQEGAERAQRAQHEAEASIHAGRQRTAVQFAARREAGQLRKAQQVCESLDTAAGISSNYLWQAPLEEEAAATPQLHLAAAPAGDRKMGAPLLRPAGFGGLLGTADDELLEEAETFRRDLTGPGQEADEQREQWRYAGPNDRWEVPGRGCPVPGPPQPAGLCGGTAGESQGGSSTATAGGKHEGRGATGSTPAAAVETRWHELPASKKLEDVLRYLREQYHYCMYCGCRYEDAGDLYESCPGMFEGDHE